MCWKVIQEGLVKFFDHTVRVRVVHIEDKDSTVIYGTASLFLAIGQHTSK